MVALGLNAGQMSQNRVSAEFQDELLSIEKRQFKLLLNIDHLEKHTSFADEVSREQKSAKSAGLGQPSHAASPVVLGGAFKRLLRWGHSACSKDESHLIVFGGYGGCESHARLNDILELNVKEGCVRFLRASGGIPFPMMAHTASTVANNMVIIGGRRSPTCILNTVIILDLKTLEWNLPQVIGAEFPPRHRHAAAVVGSKIYVHGGLNGIGILGDLHILDTSTWRWSEALCEGKLPSPRFSHSLVAIGSKLYLFGGRGRNTIYGDLHVLDLETLVWSEAEVEGIPPSPRYSHTMTAVSHYLLVIGGCPITTQGSDLVFLDLSHMSWARCPISWPLDSLLVRHSGTVVGESLVLVGGGAVCFAFGALFSPTFMVNLEPFLRHLTYPEERNLPEIHSEDLSREKISGIGKQEIAGWVLKVDKDKAKAVKDSLKELTWLDPSRKSRVIDQNSHVAFPILDVAVSILLKGANVEQVYPKSPAIKCKIDVALRKLRECGSVVLKLDMPPVSKQNSSPQDSLQKHISSLLEKNGLALSLLEELPKRWERLGDMVVLPAGSLCSSVWSSLGEDLWRTIAFSLGASRLARQAPIASTGTRDSQLQLLCGVDGWVQHRENGILYCFDALKCMFSSGNVSEKLRVAKMQCQGATVVDLFAGIGYYVLPFLLKAGARKVYACEWNPHAVSALRHNLAVNGVEAMCEVIEGDNRITAPQGVADIVSLGLLPTSEESWPVAVRALKSEGGVLLVHQNVKDSDEKVWIDYLLKSISTLATSLGRTWHVSVVHFERVKWYAPHIRHVVADIYCTKALDVPRGATLQ